LYKKVPQFIERFIENGWLLQDDTPRFYIYAQTRSGRTQYGIVGGASCSDYENGLIKKHELTRPEKEDDRMVLTRWLNANIEPVFLAYKAVDELSMPVIPIMILRLPTGSVIIFGLLPMIK